MMPSDNLNWSIAILLSLLLFSSLFLQRGAQMGIEHSSVAPSPLITRLTFNQKTETVPDVLPAIKPKTRPPVKPIKKIKPKAVTTKKSKPLEKIKKPEPVRQMAVQSQPQPQPQGQQVSVSADSVLQQKREQYLQKLLSHIESYKFYPRSARRRSVEGQVVVSLELNDDGSYQQLVLDGERSVLINATRSALESAIPFPVPAEDIEIPRKIKFVMAYTLNE